MIKLYYKNVTAEVIGDEHGVSKQQFEELAKKTSPIIEKLPTEITGGMTRYGELPYSEDTTNRIKTMVAEVKDNCENLVVLGIGGSALGNIAIQTALNPYMYNSDENQRNGPRLFVFDNVDPLQFGSFLDWIEDKLDKTLFNIISKSGRTHETIAQFLIIRELLSNKLGSSGFKDQVVAITDADKGTLRKIVNELGLKNLEFPDNVGGRYSVLSPVGLFSAAMCGIDIDALLAGARDMDTKVKNPDFFQNPAAINAAVNIHYYHRGKPMSVMMPYCYGLKDLSDWYRQLWAESLGKAQDLQGRGVYVGPTPIKALGTTDQHSQVQIYREGPNDKIYTFLEVKDLGKQLRIGHAPDCAKELGFLSDRDMGELLNAEKKATEFALVVCQRPCMTVLFDTVNPYTVGQYIYLFEATTSIAGALLGINPYDQPAVELGKDATFALMGRPEFADLLEMIQPYCQIDESFLV